MSPELYSDSEMSGSEGEELSDDDEGFEDDEYYDETEGSDVDEGFSRASSETCSETAANDNDRMVGFPFLSLCVCVTLLLVLFVLLKVETSLCYVKNFAY